MKHVTVSEVIKKPSMVTNPEEVTLIEDAKRRIAKSVVIPYAIYEKLREKIEDELYLLENADALGEKAQKDFLEIEEVCEHLGK